MDKSKFLVKPSFKKIDKPWGYELIFSPNDSPVTAKLLHLGKGKRFSLQYHDQKEEVLILVSGEATLSVENNQGEMEDVEMEKNKGYFIRVFQKHRVKAASDCDIFESSTAEKGNTFRLEDDYGRPTETERSRAKR